MARLHLRAPKTQNRHTTGGSIKSKVRSKYTRSLCFHSDVSVDVKSVDMFSWRKQNLKNLSTTESNGELISYWKFRLQITDLNDPTSVHPVGSETDRFPLLGGIKYAILFCGKRHF